MSALPRDAHSIQKEFDDLHEEIYKKGGIRPTNAAIDEVCKLIFLKLHTECCPDYRLQSGAAAAKNFTDIFHGAYIRRHGKLAVREMQDAFREISILPRYTMTINEGDVQTIFSYQEPLRLDHPDVLAKAIDILSHVKLSVSDDHLVNETQRRWEVFTHYDILGSAFDVFLRGRYDSAGGLSTHLTPIQVVDAMVDMAFNHVTDSQLWSSRDGASGEPNLPNFLIGDITCGTGRFLIRALAEVRDRILNTPNKENEEKLLWLSKVKGYSFFGADQSAASILKARINFLMFGEPHARLLTVEDSILDHYIDQLVGMFDIILTNPPFGEGKYETRLGLEKMRQEGLGLQLGWSWKPNNHSKTALRRADPALLFLDRNLQLLKPNGLLFIVLPDGILESAYAYAHEYLFSKAVFRAVVSLPKETFAIAGTTAKTSFVCLQKRSNNEQDQRSIFMAVAEHVGYIKKGNVEVPDPKGNDLPKITRAYEEFLTTDILSRNSDNGPAVVLVAPTELRGSLTPHTYHPDRIRAEETVTALRDESKRLGDLVTLAQPQLAERSSRTRFFISVLHVDEKSNVDWHAASLHFPSSKGLRCLPNDIIFSCLNPYKLRVTVIPSDIEADVLCSGEFAVLRVTQSEDPYFISLALKTTTSKRQILPLARGTSSSRRRVREQDLLDIILPYPSRILIEKLAKQFRDSLVHARTAFSQGDEALNILDDYVLKHKNKAGSHQK